MNNIDHKVTKESTFEDLINRRINLKKRSEQVLAASKQKKENYTKADKGAGLSDFLNMIKKIVKTGELKKLGTEFIPDDGPRILLDPSKEVEKPYIFYTLISRAVRANEPKPHFRENIVDYNPDGSVQRQGQVFGQVFDCDIQFNIVASDYSMADKVMNVFEDAMLRYSGFFKQNGVSEIFFKKQYTDNNLDIYRQKMSVRSLVYRVTIEKLTAVYDTTIAEIDQT